MSLCARLWVSKIWTEAARDALTAAPSVIYITDWAPKRLGSIRAWVNHWMFSTNHKVIAALYFFFGWISAMMGSTLSYAIRRELAFTDTQFLGGNAQLYNVTVTSHALIMIFFTVMPILIGGFGNLLIPILVGRADLAFPRLNNLSFWLLPHALFFYLFQVELKAVPALVELCTHL